jgi:hypothetical protein
MSSITTGAAAATLVHYIRLALVQSGTRITPDMSVELDDAVEAFREFEKAHDESLTKLFERAGP